MDTDKDLQYFVSSKEQFLVISFLGRMTKSTNAVFDACQNEIASTQAQYVVLSFHDVTNVERPVIPSLVKLQKFIRDKAPDIELRVCHLKPDLGTMLIDSGAIRREELKTNLKDALASFIAGTKKNAA